MALKSVTKALFRKSPTKITLVLAVLLLLFVVPGTASAATTSFDGYTYDDAGNTLSGVNVTVKAFIESPNPHLEKYSNVSNSSGHFNVTGVPDDAGMYIIEMEKQNGSVVEYASKSMFTPLPSQYFLDIGTNDYHLAKAATVNVTATAGESPVSGGNLRMTENHTVANYSNSLEWMNDTDQWAYVNETSNNSYLTVLDSDFTFNRSIGMPIENATALYYNGSGGFYAGNVSKSPVESHVVKFNATGALQDSYDITNTSKDNYKKLTGLERYNGSFYLFGVNKSVTVINRYNETFSFEENELSENKPVGDIYRHEGYWYTVRSKELDKLDDDWNVVQHVDVQTMNWSWQGSSILKGIAHNGTGLYVGSNETGNLSKVQLTEVKKLSSHKVSLPTSGLTFADNGTYKNNYVPTTNFNFSAPTNREYNVQLEKEGSALQLNYLLDDIESKPGWNASERRLDLDINMAGEKRSVSGYLDHNGSRNFTNVTVVYYTVWGEKNGWFAQEDRTNDDQYVPGNGYYNITIPNPAAYDNEYVLFATAYNQSEDQHYGAVQNVTLKSGGGPVTDLNMSLEPLLGNESDLKPVKDDVKVTTALKRFQLMNQSNGSAANLNKNFGFSASVTMDYTEYWPNSTEVTWNIMGGIDDWQWDSSNFTMPIFGKEGGYVDVFTPDFAPIKVSLTPDRLEKSGTVELNLTQFGVESLDQSTTTINISLYRGENTAQPDPGSPIKSSNLTEFNPLEVSLLGGNLSLRMTDEETNITVQYENVDPIKSGPPGALFDTKPESGDTPEEVWRFGSKGPDTYDQVLIGVPYNQSMEDETIVLEIPHLYDEDFNVLWNASTDSVSVIRTDPALSDFRDYLDSDYEAYLNGTGVTVDENDADLSDNLAYKDTGRGLVWLKIPHFSGVGMELAEAPTAKKTTTHRDTAGGAGSLPGAISGDVEQIFTKYVYAVTGPGNPATVRFDEGAPIKGLTVTPTGTVVDPSFRAARHVGKPDDIDAPGGTVEGYISITSSMRSSEIDSVQIEFAVPTDWLSQNDLEPGDMVLSRWMDGEWQDLDTAKVGEDAEEAVFEATSPGLSVFAVKGEKTEVTPTPTHTPTPTETQRQETGTPRGTGTPEERVPGFTALAALGALFAAVHLFRIRMT